MLVTIRSNRDLSASELNRIRMILSGNGNVEKNLRELLTDLAGVSQDADGVCILIGTEPRNISHETDVKKKSSDEQGNIA